MKIYTKKGDRGTTGLIGGARVAKDDIRVEAYGTVDELSANVAMLRDVINADTVLQERYSPMLGTILGDLMAAASELALDSQAPEQIKLKMPRITQAQVEVLERHIDSLSESLPALTAFTLPGGNVAMSWANISRTVCRRAERAVVGLSHRHEVSAEVLGYLNRLSDLLYVMGRKLGEHYNIQEEPWIPGK